MALFHFSLFPLLFLCFSSRACSQGGAEPASEECPGGAGCRGGERSLPGCPAGSSCPGGRSSGPLPCPPGPLCPSGAAEPPAPCRPCPSAPGLRCCGCPGLGQVLQPRDGLCTCPPGFRSSGRDGNVCARKSYPVCRGSASRNQEGQCLTRRGWARYCSQKVCAVPGDFRGYDKTLGLCVCHQESLERVCNSRCQKRQKSTLQLSCAEKQPQLLITHRNGSKTAVFIENLRKVLPRPNFSLEDICAAEQEIHPVHIVEMSEKGFLGVYDPDPQEIHELLVQGEESAVQETNPPSPDAPGPAECPEPTANGTARPRPRGIPGPIACLGANRTLLFLLTPQHFPLYDVNNLYNTNAEFDWGDFRSLREEIREIPRNSQEFLLFLFQFQAPGTYVLQLSSNKHKRMYVRVLPAGVQCQQPGPFLPSSPRFAVQVGITKKKDQELQLSPDWAALATGSCALLLLLLLPGLALPPLFRAPSRSPSVAFRRRQLQLRLDGFSSRIPGVYSIKKPHPSLQHPAGHPCSTAGTAGFPRPGQPEELLDLDSFSSQVFFELLLRHSQAVTSTLGHFKEEVKVLYLRALSEISSLRKLWLKALGSPARGQEEEEEEEGTEPSSAAQNPWKRILNFLHLLSSSGRHSLGQKAHPGEETANSLSPSELEDKVDKLTEELVQIVEDEEQFLSSKGNEDLLSYYLEITSLEKESLVKQIKALEEEIAQGRKL